MQRQFTFKRNDCLYVASLQDNMHIEEMNMTKEPSNKDGIEIGCREKITSLECLYTES